MDFFGGDCFSVHFTIEAAITWVLNVSEGPCVEILMLIPWHTREVLGQEMGPYGRKLGHWSLCP